MLSIPCWANTPHIPPFSFVVMDKTMSGALFLHTLNMAYPPAVCSSLTHFFSFFLFKTSTLSPLTTLPLQ